MTGPTGRPADQSPEPEPSHPVPPRTVRSDELFRGTREIIIEHEGECYRLRLTRNGKLILNK